MSAGRLTTCRHSPVSTMTLRTTLVNRPKKPFQSPGTHQRGRAAEAFIAFSSGPVCRECGDDRFGGCDPAEDATLRLDHAQPHLLKLREIRADAIGYDDAFVAAVVRLAHRGIDADLGGDPADDQLRDAAVLQHRVEVGGGKGAVPRFVDDRLARQRIKFGDDVVPGLAAYQDPAHRAGVADTGGKPAPRLLRRRQVGKIGRRNSETSLPSTAPKPPGSRKSRCMSMITRLACAASRSNG